MAPSAEEIEKISRAIGKAVEENFQLKPTNDNDSIQSILELKPHRDWIKGQKETEVRMLSTQRHWYAELPKFSTLSYENKVKHLKASLCERYSKVNKPHFIENKNYINAT